MALATVDVWTVTLDVEGYWLPPTPDESQRGARMFTETLRRRYLRSHAALRSILRHYTAAPLEFATGEQGKPYLPALPGLQFNLSHSHEMALVAVSRDVEVGVDIEHFRPLADCLRIAERVFPPADAADLADVPQDRREHEFFRRWTHIEAVLKGIGIGLYGAGLAHEGWQIQPVDVGPSYVAAVAARSEEIAVRLRTYSRAPAEQSGSI